MAYDPSRIILDGSVVLKNEDLILSSLLPCVDRFLPLPEIRLTALDGLAPLLRGVGHRTGLRYGGRICPALKRLTGQGLSYPSGCTSGWIRIMTNLFPQSGISIPPSGLSGSNMKKISPFLSVCRA